MRNKCLWWRFEWDMKITEVRNKLFGLSDLKGLIRENAFYEGEKAPTWAQAFFGDKANEKYLETDKNPRISYTGQNAGEFRDALHRFHHPDIDGVPVTYETWQQRNPGVSGTKYWPSNKEYMEVPFFQDSAVRKNFGKKVKQAYDTLGGARKKENQNIILPTDDISDRPVSLPNKPIEVLKVYFDEAGGSNIVFTEETALNFQGIKNYVNNVNLLADKVNNNLNAAGVNLTAFSDKGILVGDESNAFLLFLLFYYVKYCVKCGIGNKVKTETYIENIRNQNVKEYVKYVLSMLPNINFPNIYTTVEKNINNVNQGWKNILNSAGFGGDELSVSRSGAYFEVYQKKYGNVLNEQFLSKLSQCFSLPETILFDPVLNDMTDAMIAEGIKKWVNGKDNIALQELIKPLIVVNIDDGCPAEKIFYAARALSGLLEASYKKYGKIAETCEMTIDFLLMDGMEAINKWNRNKNKEDIPAALVPLKTIYDGKRKLSSTGEILMEENVPFWRLLNFKNEFKDKTQGEIYYFLVNNSDPSVAWQYEYNRKKKTDVDLLGQSIDILGRTDNGTYCFEYQGEQHYRPLTVTYDDYSAFPLFTEMREYILSECGFIQKTVGGTKFYSGPEDASADRMHKIREIIIRGYEEFAKRLSSSILDSGNSVAKIKGRLSEASFVPTVNKWKTVDGKKERVKFEDDTQILAYFQSIIRRGADDEEIFDAPEVGGVIPYLGSPRRFLDEVKTAQDMGRDITKRNVIRNSSEKIGWVLSYIIPAYATEDEKEYTTELAGSEEFVFPWNKEGKDKLIGFLHKNNIAVGNKSNPTTLNENKTLFGEIIREVLTNYGF